VLKMHLFRPFCGNKAQSKENAKMHAKENERKDKHFEKEKEKKEIQQTKEEIQSTAKDLEVTPPPEQLMQEKIGEAMEPKRPESSESQESTGKRVKVVFTPPRGSELEHPTQVEMCGDFCDWKNPIKLTEEDQNWVASVEMSPGRHAIKFLVDGKWALCQTMSTMLDDDGNENNCIDVA